MSGIAFVKAHACGNDFLIIEEQAALHQASALDPIAVLDANGIPDAGGLPDQTAWLDQTARLRQAARQAEHAALARRLCARNTGVGADGIEFLDRRADGSLFLRLFNADGSEAELSGNGTRCVAAWLAASEGRNQVSLGTHGGLRTCRVVRHERASHGDGGAPVWWIESAMGVPHVLRRSIEVTGVPGTIEGAMVNVGNPHFVVFTEAEDFSSHGMSWQQLGSRISVDPLFRFGTNVELVRLLAPDQIAFRIYERGCGPTTSSGTGTCASAAAAIALMSAARELTAVAQGGAQQVTWPDDASAMLLTGPAEIICRGEAEFAL